MSPPALVATLAIASLIVAPLPAGEPDLDGEVVKLGGDMKFTEGCVWLPAEKKLVFSDIPNAVHMQWLPEAGVGKLRDVEASNGNALDLEGNLVSCQHGGRNVVRWNADGSPEVLASDWEGKKFNSPNDLAVHSDGSIWFTDPSYGLKGRPAEIDGRNVYRLAPDGTITMVYGGFDMPNGIAFSPDEHRLYIADTGKDGVIRAFDVSAENTLSAPVFEIAIRCDGMCVDSSGNIYTTSAGGIHIFDPAGEKLGVIAVPEHPANVCFGCDDFSTLYITARTGLYSVPVGIAGAKPATAKW